MSTYRRSTNTTAERPRHQISNPFNTPKGRRCAAKQFFLSIFLISVLVYTRLKTNDRPLPSKSVRHQASTSTKEPPKNNYIQKEPARNEYTEKGPPKNYVKKDSAKLKHILFYTGFWDKPDFRIGYGQDPFAKCAVKTCYTTNNRTLLDGGMSDFDAIVMHGAEFRLDKQRKDYIQTWRAEHQRFVFFMMEPPTIHDFSYGYDNFWHYTMTYRRDSDIVRPYGFIVAKEDSSNQWSIPRAGTWAIDYDEKEFVQKTLPTKPSDFLDLAKRPKKVAWVVSNCDARSRREAYVKELQKYIDVDIFGKCGTIQCDVGGTQAHSGNCATTVQNEYKFYLSFENTFADDYVTEKFFLRMNMSLVPIVLGQADYNRTAPPHSFISVLDYDSPKALADYLHRLDSNSTEYLSYLWWKDYYHIESQTMMQVSFCDLCSKLHEQENIDAKPYPNFGKWWHDDSHLDEKLPKLLSMIGEEMKETKVSQKTPSLRMSFNKQ